jgi:hypothetical protein
MPHHCIVKLIELYKAGQVPGACKGTPEKAHRILLTQVIPHDWTARFQVTIAKIKAFFSMKSSGHEKLLARTTDDEFYANLNEMLELFEDELLNDDLDHSLDDLVPTQP